MFNLIAFKNTDDYFMPISQRSQKGVLFCRFIGFDDEHMIFFRKLQIKAQSRGLYVNKPIANPSDIQVREFLNKTGLANFEFNKNYIFELTHKWLIELNEQQKNNFAEALFLQLGIIASQANNQNVLKNACIKFMCWAKFAFSNAIKFIGQDDAPKILYEGDITKYELHMLRIMSLCGCDIAYINFLSDQSYISIDTDSSFSQLVRCKRLGTPVQHFTKIDLKAIEAENQIKAQANELKSLIVTNKWLSESIMSSTFKNNSIRNNIDDNKVYNIFGCLSGYDDKENYEYRLYKWKNELADSGKSIVFQEQIENPKPIEVKDIVKINNPTKNDIINSVLSQLKTTNDKMKLILQSSFVGFINNIQEPSLPKFYNLCIKFLCWLNRYKSSLIDNNDCNRLPIFIFYGACGESEIQFMHWLSYMPIDVIIINPKKDNAQEIKQYNILIEELPNSASDIFEFPKSLPKIKATTAAYSAQQELDTLLYSDTGIYRNMQFERSNALTLSTTFDEIDILWREDARYRPNFETRDGIVTVPNIFAKICGVENQDKSEYVKYIQSLLTFKTFYKSKFPIIFPNTPNVIKQNVHNYINNKKINPEAIKKDKGYKYAHLSDNIQNFILEKIQQLLDLDWIKSETLGIENLIVSSLLNLPKEITILIQQFDFTGEIPKIVILHTDEKLPSTEDGIMLLFLNLIGFDILVFTPTGYKDIEKIINENAFTVHEIGSYMFDLHIPILKPSKNQTRTNKNNQKGLFQKLFSKGRN